MKTKLLSIILAVILTVAALPFSGSAETVFTDVVPGSWYEAGVRFCSENGYMDGTGEGRFSPSAKMTRAMIVLVMAKIAGADLSVYEDAEPYFKDVKAGSWYAAAVEWARVNGVTGGMGDGTFAPGSPVTRQQVALFLMKLAEYLGYGTQTSSYLNAYDDVGKISGWAISGMLWAVDYGFISGTSATTLSPQSHCTRAQLAVMLTKFVGYYSSTCSHTWSEPSCTEGRTCLLCGYTRGTPLGHSAKPDCTTSVTCVRCGRYFPATGHQHTEIRGARAATATQTGYTGDVYCLDCGQLVESGKEIPKLSTHAFPEVEQEILRLCNVERAKVGVAPMKWNETIYPCADLRSRECEKLFSHTRPDGTDCFTVFEELIPGFTYSWVGENIQYYYGYGAPDAAFLVDNWMNSPGHRENILRPEFTTMSVGIYYHNGYVYSAQLFYTP